jgi:hypothetical protein
MTITGKIFPFDLIYYNIILKTKLVKRMQYSVLHSKLQFSYGPICCHIRTRY